MLDDGVTPLGSGVVSRKGQLPGAMAGAGGDGPPAATEQLKLPTGAALLA